MKADERECFDWITEFLTYTDWGEAPKRVYFWVGLSTIAAALRRRVWIDMGGFTWIPNLYTLLVAPPGVIAKSTSADQGYNLLAKVPGIAFGPTSTTWQALLDALQEAHVGVPYEGGLLEMSCLAINSSEFGNFLDPHNTEMVDQLVNIWDGKFIRKRTRMDGEQLIHSPCLNFIAATTPDWIAQNVPKYLVGGGLTSRMVFVYADEKAKYNAYPRRSLPHDHAFRQGKLVRDLERISLMIGEFKLTPEAEDWGTQWYENFHKVESKHLDAALIGGYIARKQTLSHKVAMCLSASRDSSLTITKEDLVRAVAVITELEPLMPMVYSRIGMSKDSEAANQIIAFLKRNGGTCNFVALYQYMHRHFPDPREFEKILLGLQDSAQINLIQDKEVRLRIELVIRK